MGGIIYRELNGSDWDAIGNAASPGERRRSYEPPTTRRTCECGWQRLCHTRLEFETCPECGAKTTPTTGGDE